MNWYEPRLLLLLCLAPLLAASFWLSARWEQQRLRRFAEEPLLPQLLTAPPSLHWFRAALALLISVLLVLAMAGPRWGVHWQQVRSRGLDLVIALDVSRSMLAPDLAPSRLERAKLALEELLRSLRGDRVALVLFAGTAFLQCPLTVDYSAFLQNLRAAEPGILPKGGTAIGQALERAIEAFEGEEGKHRAVLLLTDGEDHEGNVAAAVERATQRGIAVFTVGLGSKEGELIPVANGGYLKDRQGKPVKSRLDEERLQTIARRTGGAYLSASASGFSLVPLYEQARAQLEPKEWRTGRERLLVHRFAYFALPALLLLLIEPLVPTRRKTTVAKERGHA